MVRRINPAIVTRPTSLVLVAEISHTLRAQGNICATGLDITASGDPDNPVVSGIYKEIPQNQIGIMDYASFTENVGNFNLNSAYPDRHPWNLVSAVSLDAIFCPYNNFSDSGRAGPYMPYWTDPYNTTKAGNSWTLNPFSPFNQLYGVSSGSNINNDLWMNGGHNIAMATNYNPADSGVSGINGYVGISGVYPSGSGAPVSLYFEKDHWARHIVETSGIRAVGFKAPMVLTGWGYDVYGLPVPAATGNPSRFHENASWDTHLWKSGPVDLRWDEERGVWAGNTTKISLVKFGNLFTPPSFSFEVDRSNSRDQYTRNAPQTQQTFDATGLLYDPEYLAYTANPAANYGYQEQLDYQGLSFPFYEAFIIRETDDSPVCGNNAYNIWTQDCNDCGHITNRCGGGHGTDSKYKRVLIENPLRQSFDVGDLAFTVNTGRKQRVNTGTFVGGSGAGASGNIITNSSGNASFQVTSAGAGYLYGGFGITTSGCKVCSNLTLSFAGGELISGSIYPSGGFPANQTCAVTIYPNNATIDTVLLPIHWVLQAEFKSQQVVTYAGCDNGILQTCTMKIQTQGYKTCEWCGEDTALINN